MASDHSYSRNNQTTLIINQLHEPELDESQRINSEDCQGSKTVNLELVGTNLEDFDVSETVTAEQLGINPKDFDVPETIKAETNSEDVDDTLVEENEGRSSRENQNTISVLSPLIRSNESIQVENNFINLEDVFNQFHEFQVKNTTSPESWTISRNVSVDSLSFYNTKKAIGVLSVQMNKDFQVLIEVFGRTLPENNELLNDESFPNTLMNMNDLLFFFAYVDTFEICIGNKDKRFEEFSVDKSLFFNPYTNAFHSNNCQGLFRGKERCSFCDSLAIEMKQRLLVSQKTNSQSLEDNSQAQIVTVNAKDEDNDQYESVEIVDTEIEGTPKKRHRRSKIWDYFNLSADGYCTCKFCHNRINSNSGNTTSMRRHIRAKHICENIQLESAEKEGSFKKQSYVEEETHFPSNHPTAIKITNSIGRMIALDFQPYSIVENEGFKRVIHECEPRYKLPNETTFSSSIVPNLYNQLKEEIKVDITEAFKEEIAQSFSLTTDFWKNNSNDCFLEVTCHFATKNFEPKIYTIACLPFLENHNDEDIKKALEKIVLSIIPEERRNGVPIYDVTDRVTNITKIIDILDWTRMPCFCHTLQLSIYDSFEQLRLENTSVTKILTKVRAIVKYFKNNAHADKFLRNSQVNLFGISEDNTKRLISDVVTRWNSEYYMLLRLHELRQPLTHALLETKTIDNLSKMEWDIVKTLLDILEPFAVASKDLEGDSYPTLNMIFPALDYIEKKLKNSKSSPRHLEVEVSGVFLRNLHSKFSDYRKESLYILSTLLDPRIKNVLLDQSEKEYAMQLLKTELDETYAASDLIEVEIMNEKTKTRKRKGLWKQVEKESKAITGIKKKNLLLSEEINIYLNGPNEDPDCNVFEYWKLRARDFPHLAKLAKKLLIIPASSASSERLFSSGANIAIEKRSLLLSEHVEQLTVLNANLKNKKN